MKQLFYLLFALTAFVACKSAHTTTEEGAHTNELINETSPYLLQHAHNPVNWYPWGDKALEKAKAEDKLIVISVGYAACHWCHVMEHESFEDSIVAQIMNEHFVSIKVDREERPDVDDVYMTACQLSGGKSCGWPLNAIALPDGRPVWAGTYFPKDKWIEILEFFQKQKEEDYPKMEEFARSLIDRIDDQSQLPALPFEEEDAFQPALIDDMVQKVLALHDLEKGGRKGAPKFPLPDIYQFLQAYTYHTDKEEAAQAVSLILDNLAAGGIYDQIGGGFARYSTDADWKVPHFEKMLYDNAQLLSIYANAYEQQANPRYKQVMEETVSFMQNELLDKKGGFYSSIDADSEGEEGRFYIWSEKEIESLLTPEEFQLVKAYYQITNAGNWEHGNNILYYALGDKRMDLNEAQQALLETAKQKLFTVRAKRIRPLTDDKILTSWNGLAIIGLLDAARALGNTSYKELAIQTAELYANKAMDKEGRLWRSRKDGVFSINAFLDDYALMAQAFVKVYESTFDEQWLHKADLLLTYALAHFENPESDLYYYASKIDAPLVSRRMEMQDKVIASSNSLLAEALLSIGTYLDKKEYIQSSKRMLQSVLQQSQMKESPVFFSNWSQLLLKYTYPYYEVAIVGKDASALAEAMQKNYLPNVLYLGGKDEGTLDLLKYKAVEGETFIYVCKDKVCKLPVNEFEQAIDLVDRKY